MNSTMPKLICTDIDGTLLNKLREVDDYTVKTFAQLDKSIQVVLASSRMPTALWHIQEKLSIEQMPLICYNGALILSSGVDFKAEKVLFSLTIAAEMVNEILEISRLYQVHISLFQDNTWIASAVDFYAQREINNTRVEPNGLLEDLSETDIEAFIVKGAHKIMLMGEPERINLIEKTLRANPEIAVWRSKDIYLEITPHTNKSNGLKILLEKLPQHKITLDDVMSFGDGYNDLELLSDVKYGIAVGNAVPKLKEIAHAITETNKDHGVAKYLNSFFGLNK